MTYTECRAALELSEIRHHRYVAIATMDLQTGVLSTLAEAYLGDVI